jgi:hypothetical protein
MEIKFKGRDSNYHIDSIISIFEQEEEEEDNGWHTARECNWREKIPLDSDLEESILN